MKILFIEDNPNILRSMRLEFKHRGVVAELCSNGSDGIKKLKENAYDLAIIDLGLPDKDGETVIMEARASKVVTPLLVLTAQRSLETKTRLLNLGVDDYMEKPYSFDELYARIMAILRRSSRSFPSEYLKVGVLELIPEKRTAVRKGKKIHLRGKEYELLKYFMRHPDVVISRQTLSEEVWGYSITTFSNTVDTHIASLRSKIDKGFDKKLIKTVHGLGYMLISSLK
jgi:DNA-binding response OmpR family regulator